MEDSLDYEVTVKKCKWKHFKGRVYESIDVVFDARDAMPLVLYKSVDDGRLWVRPIKEFFEDVNGEPRFKEIGE